MNHDGRDKKPEHRPAVPSISIPTPPTFVLKSPPTGGVPPPQLPPKKHSLKALDITPSRKHSLKALRKKRPSVKRRYSPKPSSRVLSRLGSKSNMKVEEEEKKRKKIHMVRVVVPKDLGGGFLSLRFAEGQPVKQLKLAALCSLKTKRQLDLKESDFILVNGSKLLKDDSIFGGLRYYANMTSDVTTAIVKLLKNDGTFVDEANTRKSSLTSISTQQSLNEGWLHFGGSNGKKFNERRYCILNQDSLLMCKSESPDERLKPMAIVWKMHFIEVVTTSTETTHVSQSFALHSMGQDGKKNWLYLAANSHNEREQWISVLRSVIPRNPNSPYVLMDGHLWKKSSNWDKWKKKYFAIMSDRRFISFKRETDSDKEKRFDFLLSDRSILRRNDKPSQGVEPPTEFTFSLTAFPGSTSVVYFAAPSAEMRDSWISQCNYQINLYEEQQKERARKELMKERQALEIERDKFREEITEARKKHRQEIQKLQIEAEAQMEQVRNQMEEAKTNMENMRKQMQEEKNLMKKEKEKRLQDFEAEMSRMRKELVTMENTREEEKKRTLEQFKREKQEMILSKQQEIQQLHNDRKRMKLDAERSILSLESKKLKEIENAKRELTQFMEKEKELMETRLEKKIKEKDTQLQKEKKLLREKESAKITADIKKLEQDHKNNLKTLEQQSEMQKEEYQKRKKMIENKAREEKVKLNAKIKQLQAEKLALSQSQSTLSNDIVDVISSRGENLLLEQIYNKKHANYVELLNQLVTKMPSGYISHGDTSEDVSDYSDDDSYDNYCEQDQAHIPEINIALKFGEKLAINFNRTLSEISQIIPSSSSSTTTTTTTTTTTPPSSSSPPIPPPSPPPTTTTTATTATTITTTTTTTTTTIITPTVAIARKKSFKRRPLPGRMRRKESEEIMKRLSISDRNKTPAKSTSMPTNAVDDGTTFVATARQECAYLTSKSILYKRDASRQKQLGRKYILHVYNDLYLPTTPMVENIHRFEIHNTVHIGTKLKELNVSNNSTEFEENKEDKPKPNKKQIAFWRRYASFGKVGYTQWKLKYNQDRCLEIVNFGGETHKALFGVFDGHGPYGHDISQFCIENFPKILLQNNDYNNLNIKNALVTTMEECHEQCIKKIDASSSGTTAVVIYLQGKDLYCANLGDSRAILAIRLSESHKNLKAIPLSKDHKPDCEEEKKRIISAGGRVEKSKTFDGEEVGTSRVWLNHVDMPGLAMARSIGDTVAHSVGVIATPEIFEMQLPKDAQFFVIASDGVWEFMDNEEVITLIDKALATSSSDIGHACRKLITEATRRWNENEPEITDDISCVICSFT